MNQPEVPESIRQRYGGKPHDSLNRAMRAEEEGGAETLDAIHALHSAKEAAGESTPIGQRLVKALKQATGARRLIADAIIERYRRHEAAGTTPPKPDPDR